MNYKNYYSHLYLQYKTLDKNSTMQQLLLHSACGLALSAGSAISEFDLPLRKAFLEP